MLGLILLGCLAAFGALCGLWLLVGMWIPGDRAGLTIYCWRDSTAGRGFVVRWRTQWELGLLQGRLLIIDLGITADDRQFLTRWGKNLEILETEREHGERIGDYPGRDCRRGISEL